MIHEPILLLSSQSYVKMSIGHCSILFHFASDTKKLGRGKGKGVVGEHGDGISRRTTEGSFSRGQHGRAQTCRFAAFLNINFHQCPLICH